MDPLPQLAGWMPEICRLSPRKITIPSEASCASAGRKVAQTPAATSPVVTVKARGRARAMRPDLPAKKFIRVFSSLSERVAVVPADATCGLRACGPALGVRRNLQTTYVRRASGSRIDVYQNGAD